jgi:hypothetical protein
VGARCRLGNGLVLSLLVGTALLGGFASPAAASPGALKILIAEEQCDSTQATTLQSEILAQPGVAAVDFADVDTATPSDAQLDAYDVVFFMGNCSPSDSTTIGNNLADYEDQGGVVVAATFDWQGTAYVAGRWVSGDYSPYQVGAGADFGSNTLGTHDASNPLLAGVSSLNGFYVDAVSLTPGATEIARWSGGDSAVAVKGQAVGINAYLGDYYTPVSTVWSGDFAKIIVNAGNVLGRHTLSITKQGDGAGTVTTTPPGIDCGATCAFAYANGTAVTLTATPSAGSTFAGWSGGGCSGTLTCTVTMNAAQTVTATFTLPIFPPQLKPPSLTKITKAKINKKKHTASFTFTASGTVTGFQCALVKPSKKGKHHKKHKLVFSSCRSHTTYKHLKSGRYTIEVRAVNSAGHDPNPAIKKFRI